MWHAAEDIVLDSIFRASGLRLIVFSGVLGNIFVLRLLPPRARLSDLTAAAVCAQKLGQRNQRPTSCCWSSRGGGFPILKKSRQEQWVSVTDARPLQTRPDLSASRRCDFPRIWSWHSETPFTLLPPSPTSPLRSRRFIPAVQAVPASSLPRPTQLRYHHAPRAIHNSPKVFAPAPPNVQAEPASILSGACCCQGWTVRAGGAQLCAWRSVLESLPTFCWSSPCPVLSRLLLPLFSPME